MNEKFQNIDETVGPDFSDQLLVEARDVTLKVIEEAKELLTPGITEEEIELEIEKIQEQFNVERAWHKPQVRFGLNTTLAFGIPGIKQNKLKENDIVFMDLGLVYKGHEGDVGRAYSVGDDEIMKKCCQDVEAIWKATEIQWKEFGHSGEKLYDFATQMAHELGWKLVRKNANGHRVSDFPHIVRNRKASVDELTQTPLKNRWILEIQILAQDESFGAFYEDLMS